jgi:hypothetical protein
MADPQRHRNDDGTIEEPPNSTVDDWFGQNAARDADLADDLVEQEKGDADAAEERYEKEAKGKEKYRAGHRRPT